MRGRTTRGVLAALLIGSAVAVAPVSAQPSCGNAYYDDGTSVDFGWFGGGWAGDANHMFAVKFSLADFGLEPGKAEIYGLCAANQINLDGTWANEVFVYPDNNGAPDDSQVLAHGTIITGNGAGDWIVMFSKPVPLAGDFWLVNRGHPPFEATDFNLEFDASPDGGHSYLSSSGIAGLTAQPDGDWALRAYLRSTDRSYLHAGMAHLDGFGGTHWRSKVVVLNPGTKTAMVTLTFVQGSGSVSKTVTLQPGQMMAWDDVAVDLFELTGSPSGSVRVDSDVPIISTARTFNETSEGTYGQYYPGIVPSDTLAKGAAGIISMLTKSSEYRTNIGFINLSDHNCRVRITLHDANGNVVGSPVELTVSASGWKQSNDTFVVAGAGNVANGYATVEVLDDDCEIWGYASVINVATGDPTTVPLLLQ